MYARQPAPPLSEFVSGIWAVEGYVAGPHRHERYMPSGDSGLIIPLSDAFDPIFSGPHSRSFVLATSAQVAVAGIGFRAGGAVPFIPVPLTEAANIHVSLADLWGAFARELHERVVEADGLAAKVRVIECALAARLARARRPRTEVAYALRRFRCASGTTIADVACGAGLSRRRLADLFAAEVGLTPKVFCRVRRFHRALRETADRRAINWTAVALDCGYYDQAHFTHDFREFAGLTPTEYERQRVSINHVALAD